MAIIHQTAAVAVSWSNKNRRTVGVVLVLLATLVVFLTARRSAQARGDTADNPYRCHLDEDTACTIVRQTARGLVVLTYRPPGAVESSQPWSVVVSPGTVTIVPVEVATGKTLFKPAPPATSAISSPPSPAVGATGLSVPNGAPIID